MNLPVHPYMQALPSFESVDRHIDISISLAHRTPTRIDIIDALGRVVATPFDGILDAGDHAIPLDLAGSSHVSARGFYLCRLTTDRAVTTRPLIVVGN